MRKLLAALAVSLVLPSAAAAGGFATVGLDSPPDGSRTWRVELTILQHGRTPLDGLDPKVIVERGSVRRVFAAVPAGAPGAPGVYRAEVVFPGPGTWHYVVDDGFTATHTFPPVRVGNVKDDSPTVEAASTGGGPDIPLALAVAVAAGVAAGIAGRAMRRARPDSR